MFNVTLVNLSPDARQAAAGLGLTRRENLPAAELAQLLEAFRGLDPLQNAADPEIRILSAYGSYFIRTERGRLFLYDARNRAEPACELAVADILAELDGTALARRTAVPFTYQALPEGAVPGQGGAAPVASTPERRPPPYVRLGVAGVLLAVLTGWHYWLAGPALHPPLSFVAPAEREAALDGLPGVYLAGSQPGDHGIVVMDGASLKIFQINARTAPGMIQDTYRLRRLGQQLVLLTNQPGGPIVIGGPDTLLYGGETYRRIR